MKKNAKKRFLSWIIAFLMVFTYMPAMAYATETDNVDAAVPAAASAGTEAEISVLDGQVLITNSKGTGSLSGDIVTITAEGVFPGQPTANEIKIYNKSGKTATLSFDYIAKNYRDDKEGGFSEPLDDSTYTVLLEPEEYATLSITGKRAMSDNVAVLTMNNFELEFAADTSDVTFSYDEALGSVYAGGEKVAPGAVKAVTYAEGEDLEAVAAEGNEFLGWINAETGKILSREAAYKIKPTKNISVEAVFSGDASETYYLVGEQYLMTGFNESAAKAAGLIKKTVVLMKDTTLTAGNYTIPAGVTFLVPFDKENTLYTEPGTHMSVWGTYEKPYAYRTLTLGEGANIVVNGALSLSANHFAANGGGRASASPAGPVSFLEMDKNSKVTVNNGGTLYAYGFVTGEGTVSARNGSNVYEMFQVEDFRGGGASATMAMNNMEKGVLPISQYYIQNIEVPLTLEAGAVEYVYASFFMTQSSLGAAVPFIGGPTAMFYISEGEVVKEYDGSTDRLIVEADGTMSLSPITVSVSGQTLNSRDFDLGINSNISVVLKGGDVTINQDLAMLPGSELVIEEGATCTLGKGNNIFIYDADQWSGYCGTHNVEFVPVSYAPGRTYNRTKADLVDAAVKVNGKLNATEGYIYTTTDAELKGGHANFYSTGNGVVEIASGTQECTYQFKQSEKEGTFDQIPLLPANLKNADGSFVQTDGGKYTYVDIAWQCDHKVTDEKVLEKPGCETTGIKLVTCEYGHEYKALITATGHTEVIDPAVEGTCTVDARTEGSHCSVCDKVLVPQVITPAPGHTEIVIKGVPATCTEGGVSDGKYCFVCNEVLAKQEPLDPLGHNWIVEGTEPTCTIPGFGSSYCDACGESVEDSIIPALGHNYSWETVKDPECEVLGIRAGKCTREECGHETVDYIDPTGHDTVKTEAVDATCTEDGHEEYWTCTVCEGIFEDAESAVELTNIPVIKAAGHDAEKHAAVKATCTEDGQEEYWTCEGCGGMFSDAECKEAIAAVPVIRAEGHEGVKTEAVEATCTTDGNAEYWTCSCGALFADADCTEELEAVPVTKAAGHDLEAVKAAEADCTTDGNGQYWHCGTCDGIYADPAGRTELEAAPVIKAAGHSAAKVPAVKATCTEDGNKEYWICTACEGLFADEACEETIAEVPVIKAAGHKAEKVEASAATCTEPGNAEYWTCQTCKGIFEDGVCETELSKIPAIKAKGHRWEAEYTTDIAATCTKPGSESIHCRDCDASKDAQAVPAADHSYGAEQYQVPTAEADGGWYKVCKACDHKIWTKVQTWAEYVKVGVNATAVTVKASASQKTETITVSWTKDGSYDMARYDVYRSRTGKAGSYGKIGQTTDLKYEDKTAKPGVTYYYKVRGAHNLGNYTYYTKWSNAATAKIKKVTEAYIKESKMFITTYHAAKGVKVTWTNPRIKVDGYEVWTSTVKNGKYKKLTTVKGNVYQATHNNLKLQSRHFYKVRGYKIVNGKKVYTKWSALGYRYVLNAKDTKLANAINGSASITATTAAKANGGIKVTWNKTDDNVKVFKYRVYRSTSKNGTYKQIATTSNKYYVDKSNLKKGTRYYYKVQGYRYFGKALAKTKLSNPVSAVK